MSEKMIGEENGGLGGGAVFPKGGPLPEVFAKNFIGQAYLEMLVPGDSEFNCPIGNVTFEPGCRNNWHRHPGGQILLVTGGRGWYCECGKEARAARGRRRYLPTECEALARRGARQLVFSPFGRNELSGRPRRVA